MNDTCPFSDGELAALNIALSPTSKGMVTTSDSHSLAPCSRGQSPAPLTLSDDELVELEILRDAEIDAMVEQGFIPRVDRWNVELREGFSFAYPEATLDISTGDEYPVRPLTYHITNHSLPRLVVDQLRAKLRTLDERNKDIDTYERWCARHSSEASYFEPEMAALQIVTETIAHLNGFRSDPAYRKDQISSRDTDYKLSLERREILKDYYHVPGLLPRTDEEEEVYDPLNPDWSKKDTDKTTEQKLSFPDVQRQNEITNSMFGIDPSSIQGHGLANAILGKTPEEICAKIPETFRILHIESVIRSDLVSGFLRRQAVIRKDLEKLPLNILKGSVKREVRLGMGRRVNEPETLIEHLVTPDLTFHCTREDLIPSIVRQGFLKPEDEKDIRCGATYGQLHRAQHHLLQNIH